MTFVCADCRREYQSPPPRCVQCQSTQILDSEELAAFDSAAAAVDAAEPRPSAPSVNPSDAGDDSTRICPAPNCGATLPNSGLTQCPYCGVDLQALRAPSLVRKAHLVAADGTEIPLRPGMPVALGRDPKRSAWARLMENAPKVSNMHAEVESDGCQLYVRDIGSGGQGSTNGTFVQGIRVRGAASLDLADGIEIGLGRDFKLIVRADGD